jgi:hypothetical protein
MNRIAAIALLSFSLSSVPALAAGVNDPAEGPTTTSETAAVSAIAAPAARELTGAEWTKANRRPAALPGLYASLAALQMFDGYSTHRALAAGGREANPLMKNAVGSRAAFWTIKAAMTVGPMLAAERLWKTNKVGAIAMMVATNGVMAAVAAHNAGVVKNQR